MEKRLGGQRPTRIMRMIVSNPIVSVIVPVHNAEKYLEQCLESILGQTLGDIEVICVNDRRPMAPL